MHHYFIRLCKAPVMSKLIINKKSKIIVYASLGALFVISLAWNLYSQRVKDIEMLKNTARISISKYISFRDWAASHGGVYVQIDENTPPNPYLSFMPDRDLNIGDKNLTLMNPAYMLRQLLEQYTCNDISTEHITSLKPLNPNNAPDEWEREALEEFESGVAEISSIVNIDNNKYLRLMVPLITKQACMKCHEHQGYEVGDVRGGLSMTIRLKELLESAKITMLPIILSHLFFLILAVIIIYIVFKTIENHTKKILMQKELLLKQAKHAQMGEMLSMIAHQWRQPLNAMGLSAIKLSMQQEIETVGFEDIDKHSRFIQEQTQKMSKIINDFMGFFKPDKEKQLFTIKNIIEDIESLMVNQLQSRGIKIIYDAQSIIMVNSYRKELSHVLVNLIANSRDAYEGKSIAQKTITISISQDEGRQSIIVKDNAGGIPDEIMDDIFKPYFTTKGAGLGTGIGLSMSKMIVNDILHGTIEVRNEDGGAIFTITLD